MFRLLVAVPWSITIVLALVRPCAADSIYLNAEGRKNLDILRLRIVPAVVLQDPARGMPFIRGVIVGERPAPKPAAPYKTLDGSPEYDVIAFDSTGDRRSEPFTISDAWIEYVQPDFDSELDIRAAFSNRDELTGVALASRAYFGMVRRAIDPKGTLGLWRNDLQLPPEPSGVREGTAVRFLRDPPVVGTALPAEWIARDRAATMERIKDALAKRLPTAHLRTWEGNPSGLVMPLVGAIARERAYRLSGFERAALSILVFVLDLAGVQDGTPSAGAARAVRDVGTEGLQLLITSISSLTSPGRAGDEVQCAWEASFCLDWSQRVAVMIDALMLSEGLFTYTTWTGPLAEGLVSLHVPPRVEDAVSPGKVDVRGPAMRLLVHVLNPPPGRDAASTAARRTFSKQVRDRLYRILGENGRAERHAVVRQALGGGGWGDAQEFGAFVTGLLDDAVGYAGSAHHAGNPERERFMRDLAAMRIRNLRALAELAGSSAAHERAAAGTILQRVEELRVLVKKAQDSGGARVFLEIWDALAAKPQE